MKNRIINQLTAEEERVILNNPMELERVVHLQEESIKEYERIIDNTKRDINDKEELATKWMGILIVIGLVQLYPFGEASNSINYLILTLPTFCIAFYTTALTLFRHPSTLTTDNFIAESKNWIIRYHKNKAMIEIYTKAGQSVNNAYQWKSKFLKYTGPSVLVNFTLSILFLISQIILKIFIADYLYLVIAILSVILVSLISRQISKNNFVLQYTFDISETNENESNPILPKAP